MTSFEWAQRVTIKNLILELNNRKTSESRYLTRFQILKCPFGSEGFISQIKLVSPEMLSNKTSNSLCHEKIRKLKKEKFRCFLAYVFVFLTFTKKTFSDINKLQHYHMTCNYKLDYRNGEFSAFMNAIILVFLLISSLSLIFLNLQNLQHISFLLSQIINAMSL